MTKDIKEIKDLNFKQTQKLNELNWFRAFLTVLLFDRKIRKEFLLLPLSNTILEYTIWQRFSIFGTFLLLILCIPLSLVLLIWKGLENWEEALDAIKEGFNFKSARSWTCDESFNVRREEDVQLIQNYFNKVGLEFDVQKDFEEMIKQFEKEKEME